MAERRAAGFLVPLDFYDGPEVKSIPRRVRAAAVGVWTLAGNYSATKLTDGYIDAETLQLLGCTPAVRAALMATSNVRGEISPLWIDGHDGGVQFTNWPKWQRTNGEVAAYREAEAERKRRARSAKIRRKSDGTTAYLTNSYAELTPNVDVTDAEDNRPEPPATSTDYEISARTTAGRPASVRSTKTETETKTESLSVVTSRGELTRADARETPPPRTCPDHPDGTTTNCGGCGDARRKHDAWTRNRNHADATQRRQSARAAAQAITNCPLCDDNGYRGLSVCDHTDRADTNRNGLAAVRAALSATEATSA